MVLKISTDLLGEPQTLAQLQHTNIVPIYSAHQARPFQAVCMPYFGGASLSQVLDELWKEGMPPARGEQFVQALVAVGGPSLAAVQNEARATANGPLAFLRQADYVRAALWLTADGSWLLLSAISADP